MGKIRAVWQYRLWSFQGRDKKLEGLRLKINSSQMKLPNLGIRGKEETTDCSALSDSWSDFGCNFGFDYGFDLTYNSFSWLHPSVLQIHIIIVPLVMPPAFSVSMHRSEKSPLNSFIILEDLSSQFLPQLPPGITKFPLRVTVVIK